MNLKRSPFAIQDKNARDLDFKIKDHNECYLRYIYKMIFSFSSFLRSIGIYAISFFIALMASLYFSSSD